MKNSILEISKLKKGIVMAVFVFITFTGSIHTSAQESAKQAPSFSTKNCKLNAEPRWISGDKLEQINYCLNIESPWENGGEVSLHFPEHLEYNPVGNGILRNSDNPQVQWIITPDRKQASYRVESPVLKSVFVETSARVEPIKELPGNTTSVKFTMKITNNGSERLPVIRTLLCMPYGGLKGFPRGGVESFKNNFILIDGELTALSDLSTVKKNTTFKGCVVKGCPQHDTRAEKDGGLIEKEMDLALSIVTSLDHKRKVIIWWTPGKSMIANVNIPCIHADPYFGTLNPGQEASAEGLIIFTESDVEPIITYLKKKDKRVF